MCDDVVGKIISCRTCMHALTSECLALFLHQASRRPVVCWARAMPYISGLLCIQSKSVCCVVCTLPLWCFVLGYGLLCALCGMCISHRLICLPCRLACGCWLLATQRMSCRGDGPRRPRPVLFYYPFVSCWIMQMCSTLLHAHHSLSCVVGFVVAFVVKSTHVLHSDCGGCGGSCHGRSRHTSVGNSVDNSVFIPSGSTAVCSTIVLQLS